jgi:hypothetical protein
MISHRIFWILSRGGWVSMDALTALCKDCVRPEYAVRLAQQRSKANAENLEDAIKYGIKQCIRQAFWDMKKQGLIEIVHEDLSPSDGGRPRIKKVRLVDNVWDIILSKDKQMFGKLLTHLRKLIEQRRCEIWIEVTPPNHKPIEREEPCTTTTQDTTTSTTETNTTTESPTQESLSPTPT